jgi:hypothetical protein
MLPRRTSGNGGVAGSSITSQSQSGSWMKSKTNVRRIVNQFLFSTEEHKTLASSQPTFDSITPDQACNEKLYEEFARYLANEYTCGAGKNKDKQLGGPCGQLLEQPCKETLRQAQTCE